MPGSGVLFAAIDSAQWRNSFREMESRPLRLAYVSSPVPLGARAEKCMEAGNADRKSVPRGMMTLKWRKER